MELKQFKQYVESLPKGTIFNYGISKPFSWRGIYAEVAFSILNEKMTKEQILENINLAHTETFYGYKGGDFTYDDNTDIHFEQDYGSWTDGRYTSQWIAEIEQQEEYQSQEARLVKLAFKNQQPNQQLTK